ncbi:hypothetical protein M9H77_11507 [Catharanthus roseus]|uniref:Uncharacterized protein n=1 Tax=Catharanthus roseus TaxID=4058 RepID=A0ACC0BEV0_CATRO|nr:hypothetical protein M9H77_11507 [Catharanthus roseus]
MASISNLPYVEGSSTNRPPLFNGTNYTFRKSRIRIYIISINFDLWSIVEKGPYIPKKDGIVKNVEEYDENSIGFYSLSLYPLYQKSLYSSSSHTLSRDCFKRVKTKNADIRRGVNIEEGGSSRGRGKGKRVPSGIRALDKFIYAKEVAKFEEWTRNRRKIAAGHRVDLNDM